MVFLRSILCVCTGLWCSLLSFCYDVVGSCGNSDILFSLKNVYAFSCSSSVFIITVQFPLSAFTKVRWFCDCFCMIVCRVLLSLSVMCFLGWGMCFLAVCLRFSWCSGFVFCMAVSRSNISFMLWFLLFVFGLRLCFNPLLVILFRCGWSVH